MSLELIRYLVPDVFRGALLDSLSGHALSATALAAAFTPEGRGAPAASICSVIKAQQPGWSPTPLQDQPGAPTVSMSYVLGTTRVRGLRGVQTHQACS